jgi:hypothetical protein
VTKVLGNHTLKFGGETHLDQVNANPIAQFNGDFVFSGTETGVDFADFLIGVPSQYNQSQLNPFYARNQYFGLFAQDSWHARPNLTVNYGLRWDRIAPWSEKYNQISTFVAGAQSVVFPGAPAGILYPGDPGVSKTLAPVGELSLAPRVGWPGRRRRMRAALLGSCWARRERRAFAPVSATSIRRSMRFRSACWRRMLLMGRRTPVRKSRCLRRPLLARRMELTTASLSRTNLLH